MMKTVEQRVCDDLEPLGIPVFQQGDWTGGELPAEFVTYYPVTSTDVRHYDGMPYATETQMQVNIYVSDPDRIDQVRKRVSSVLLRSGWTRTGRGEGGELDGDTHRFPWFMTFYYYEKEEI